MTERPAYLQNSMTGAIDEFASWGEAFDTMIRRNKREHWSLSMSRPEPFEPRVFETVVIPPISGPGIGSYERAAHCERYLALHAAGLTHLINAE